MSVFPYKTKYVMIGTIVINHAIKWQCGVVSFFQSTPAGKQTQDKRVSLYLVYTDSDSHNIVRGARANERYGSLEQSGEGQPGVHMQI